MITFALLLIVIAAACMICMPIAHSASLATYERALQSRDKNDSQLYEPFLKTAGKLQALCYFFGAISLVIAIAAGMIIGDHVNGLRHPEPIAVSAEVPSEK